MATAGSVVIDLLLNSGSFESNVKQSEASIKRLVAKFEELTGQSVKAVEAFDENGKAVKKLAIGYDALTGANRLVEASYKSLRAEMERLNATQKIAANEDANLLKLRMAREAEIRSASERAIAADEARSRAQQQNTMRAQQEFQARQAALSNSNNLVTTTTDRMTSAYQKSQAGFRSTNQVIQNSAYQLTDFVVQIQGGTSALRAFSQQAPQFLGAFGGAGAVLGIFAALGGAIADFVVKMNSAKTAAEVIDELTDRTGKLAEAANSVSQIDLSTLGKNYREASDEGKALIDANVTLQLELLKLSQIDALRNFRLGVRQAVDDINVFRKSLMDITDRLIPAWQRITKSPGDIAGFIKKDSLDVFASFNDISKETAKNIDASKKAFAEGSISAGQYVKVLGEALKNTKSPSKEFVNRIIEEQTAANAYARATMQSQAFTGAQQSGYQVLEKAPSSKATKADNTLEKMFNNQRVGADKFVESMQRANEQVEFQSSLLGKSAQEVEILNAQYRIQAELEKTIQDIERQNGTIRTEEFERMKSAAAEALAIQTNAIMSRQEMERSASYGIERGMKSYAESAGNAAKGMESVFNNAFKGMENALVQFAITGKMNFGDMVNAMIADLIRFQMQMALAGLAKMAISAFAGSASSSGGMSSSTQAATYGGAKPMFGFSDGGYTGDGGKYQPAGVVHAGEFVMNKQATSRIGVGNLYKMMRGYADGGLVGSSPLAGSGNAGNVNINIKNEAGGDGYQATATARKNESGLDVEILVRKVMGDDLRRNGPMSQQMTNTFGLRRAM